MMRFHTCCPACKNVCVLELLRQSPRLCAILVMCVCAPVHMSRAFMYHACTRDGTDGAPTVLWGANPR